MEKLDMSKEYSDRFDELRKNRIEIGFYKYGPAHNNYTSGNIQAIPSMERCVQRYKDTGNTEFLVDAANFLMLEFMFPQHEKAHFRSTDSGESTGIVGMSVNEMERFRNGLGR